MINKNVMNLLVGKQVKIYFYPSDDDSLTLHTKGKLLEFNSNNGKGYLVQNSALNAIFKLKHIKEISFGTNFVEITLGNINDSKS